MRCRCPELQPSGSKLKIAFVGLVRLFGRAHQPLHQQRRPVCQTAATPTEQSGHPGRRQARPVPGNPIPGKPLHRLTSSSGSMLTGDSLSGREAAARGWANRAYPAGAMGKRSARCSANATPRPQRRPRWGQFLAGAGQAQRRGVPAVWALDREHELGCRRGPSGLPATPLIYFSSTARALGNPLDSQQRRGF